MREFREEESLGIMSKIGTRAGLDEAKSSRRLKWVSWGQKSWFYWGECADKEIDDEWIMRFKVPNLDTWSIK